MRIFKALIILKSIGNYSYTENRKYTLLLTVSSNSWSMFKMNNKEIVCTGELNN